MGVGAGIGFGVGVRIGVGTGIGVGIGVGVGLGLGVGIWHPRPVHSPLRERSLPVAALNRAQRSQGGWIRRRSRSLVRSAG